MSCWDRRRFGCRHINGTTSVSKTLPLCLWALRLTLIMIRYTRIDHDAQFMLHYCSIRLQLPASSVFSYTIIGNGNYKTGLAWKENRVPHSPCPVLMPENGNPSCRLAGVKTKSLYGRQHLRSLVLMRYLTVWSQSRSFIPVTIVVVSRYHLLLPSQWQR